MADIFVSYASEDRERVLPLIEAMEARGWSLWWDRQIDPGASFDTTIEKAISEASCVVAIWTQNSVHSNWVQNEAMDGLNRNILVPVLLDDVEMPLAFRRTQAARLGDWPKDGAVEFERFLRGVTNILANGEEAAVPEASEAWSANQMRSGDLAKRKKLLIGAGLLSGLLLVAGLSTTVLRDTAAPGPVKTAKAGQYPLSSIAVLPLTNLSGDTEQAFFVAGLHDAIITDLARISGLSVISRTSTLGYNGTTKTIPQIGQELSVGTLVEGSVLKVGDQFRLQVQLINAATDKHIWAETYDRTLDDVLSIYSEIARVIAGKVAVALKPAESAQLARVRTVNPGTYESYLRGMYHVRLATPEDMSLGLALLKEAVTRDPEDPLAWAGLALAWSVVGHGPNARPDALRNGQAAALKALELDPDLAEVHAALAETQMYYSWDWKTSGTSFERAIDLNPSLAVAHAHYSWHHALYADWDEALNEQKLAHKLDPLNPLFASWVAWMCVESGDLDEALHWAEKTIEINPGFPVGHYVMGLVQTNRGNFSEAIAAHERAGAISPAWAWGLPHTLAAAGRDKEARDVLATMAEVSHPDAWALAMAFTTLGDHDEAIRWLEYGYETRRDWMPWIGINAALAPLQDDPRMVDLKRRMGLPV